MDEISSVPVDRLWRPAESPAYSQQDAPRRQQQDKRPATPTHDDDEEPHEIDKHASVWDMVQLTSAIESSIHEAIEALSKGAADRFLECVSQQERLCGLWREQLQCERCAVGGHDARTLAGLRNLRQAAQLYQAVIERAEAANRALSGALGISCQLPGEF